MSDLRTVPPYLAQMPLRYRVWVMVLYIVIVTWLGLLSGGIIGLAACWLVAGFSFQFWVYAAWNGLRKSEDMGKPDDQV